MKKFFLLLMTTVFILSVCLLPHAIGQEGETLPEEEAIPKEEMISEEEIIAEEETIPEAEAVSEDEMTDGEQPQDESLFALLNRGEKLSDEMLTDSLMKIASGELDLSEFWFRLFMGQVEAALAEGRVLQLPDASTLSIVYAKYREVLRESAEKAAESESEETETVEVIEEAEEIVEEPENEEIIEEPETEVVIEETEAEEAVEEPETEEIIEETETEKEKPDIRLYTKTIDTLQQPYTVDIPLCFDLNQSVTATIGVTVNDPAERDWDYLQIELSSANEKKLVNSKYQLTVAYDWEIQDALDHIESSITTTIVFTIGECNSPFVGLEYSDTLTFTITPHFPD